jgi:hypothetical protein
MAPRGEVALEVTESPSISSVTEALAMVRGGLGYLVAADAAELPAGVQAQCLRGFEQFDAMSTAARAQMLASFLRRSQLGARLGGPSLPLDVGFSENVPAGIRTAVRLRDQHCRWSGGCLQPAAGCEIHHVKPKSRGGKTSLKDCVLLCWFHHHVMIHRRGWTLVLNPDGTTTAWNPDKTKVLHSHGPPARAG